MLIGETTIVITKETMRAALQEYFDGMFKQGKAPIIEKVYGGTGGHDYEPDTFKLGLREAT